MFVKKSEIEKVPNPVYTKFKLSDFPLIKNFIDFIQELGLKVYLKKAKLYAGFSPFSLTVYTETEGHTHFKHEEDIIKLGYSCDHVGRISKVAVSEDQFPEIVKNRNGVIDVIRLNDVDAEFNAIIPQLAFFDFISVLENDLKSYYENVIAEVKKQELTTPEDVIAIMKKTLKIPIYQHP